MDEHQQLQMLMSQLQDSELRQSVMQYINQTANGLDKDANSKSLIETLARESMHNQKSTATWKSRAHKSVAAGVVAVVLAITVQFFVNYCTNELSKESHVDKQGAMVSTDGKVVKTQMEEMMVDADGKLLSRNGDAAVKTMPSLAKIALASSLPDATLMALDQITVHSDKGYTMQIKVHGISRVPVLNSRCGNVVHFYTAWKGKVTLDSTDLSFDEATAAEFSNAGFSLAMGGRRLAGKITVDGFARALDGMKGGKWTCADVPLPTFSELGERKEIIYDKCGTQNDKTSMCYSKYGGLKVGVTALEGGVASAVTNTIDRMGGKQTKSLFVKSSSSVMNSELYRVSFSEYPSHPGQQLVAISDLKSGGEVRFQMESDQSRSHCIVSRDENQKNNHEAQNSNKLDSDWHFEYMGTNEEDGQMLRHFRIIFSSEFMTYLYGDASKASALNFAEFWDVAETLQPERLILGGASITVFESYTQGITDADVQAAVRTRTNKTVSELMVCNVQEARTKTIRPRMGLFDDLELPDRDYYEVSSATKSEAFSKYLDASDNDLAMPDVCYEKCRTSVDAVVRRGGNICEGTALASALQCLEETHMMACSSSVFSSRHTGKCRTKKKTHRTLQESEDAESEDAVDTVRTLQSEDAKELLVNETFLPVSTSRKLSISMSCPGPISPLLMMIMPVITQWGVGICVKIEVETKKGQYKNGKNSWANKKAKTGEKGVMGQKFVFELGWIYRQNWMVDYALYGFKRIECGFSQKDWDKLPPIGMKHNALWIKLEYCGNVGQYFGIPPPLTLTACVGGSVDFTIETSCPGVHFHYKGRLYIELAAGATFWVNGSINIASIRLEAETGLEHTTDKMITCQPPGRRRAIRKCTYAQDCDQYVKGAVILTVTVVRAQFDFKYWTKAQVFEIHMTISIWGWKWWPVYETVLMRRDYSKDVEGETEVADEPSEEFWKKTWLDLPTLAELGIAVADQSSTTAGGVAERAIDGNRNRNYEGGSCTHTESYLDSWWQVNLGMKHRIWSVRITNRGQGLGWRLNPFDVWVDDQLCRSGNSVGDGYTKDIECDLALEGTVVRVQKHGPGPLTICEFEVNGAPVQGSKPFIAKTGWLQPLKAWDVRQSSTAHGGVAERAIDGNSDKWWNSSSCTHTDRENNPWWEVDLGMPHKIEAVLIANRGEDLGHRLNPFDVLIDDKECAVNRSLGDGERGEVECHGIGQIIRIQKRTNDFYTQLLSRWFKPTALTICEFKVKGSAIPGWLEPMNAMGRTARQSSTTSRGVAERAIDGNEDTNYGGGSCTHTGGEDNPWWEVNLGRRHKIEAVWIANRGEGLGHRLNPFDVLIDNEACARGLHFGDGQKGEVKCHGEGQIIRVRKQGPGPLTICEFKVKGRAIQPTLQNPLWLDLTSTRLDRVRQSSTAHGGAAERAIDGNKDSNWGSNSCTHTNSTGETDPWWQVDLGKPHRIKKVAIQNRGEGLGHRLNPFSILIDEKPCAGRFLYLGDGQEGYFECEATGRFVKVQKRGPGPLTLCEVNVYGAPSDADDHDLRFDFDHLSNIGDYNR